MKCSLVAKEIGFIAALRFIRKNITESESSDFTATKAVKGLYSLFTKLQDFSETNNLAASAALKKLIQVSGKNATLRKVDALARGEGIWDPSQIGIYAFARCTSVEVERAFFYPECIRCWSA